MRKSQVLVLLALAGSWSCDSSGPGTDNTRPPGELNILTLAQTAPPLVTDSVGFWARVDEDTQGQIDFVGGERYLRFEVKQGSLLTRPNGTPFLPGDSIFIAIKVVDPALLLFEFQPAGLAFSPAEPARLSLEYNHAGTDIEGDFNDDGVVNGKDDDIEASLDLWRQQDPGNPFTRLQGLIELELDEVEVDILHFTRYALAY